MAETQWLEYDEVDFDIDIDTDFFGNPVEDIDIPVAIDAFVLDDFDCALTVTTFTTLALGEDDPWPLEADVRVVSVSDLA